MLITVFARFQKLLAPVTQRTTTRRQIKQIPPKNILNQSYTRENNHTSSMERLVHTLKHYAKTEKKTIAKISLKSLHALICLPCWQIVGKCFISQLWERLRYVNLWRIVKLKILVDIFLSLHRLAHVSLTFSSLMFNFILKQ